MLPFEGRAKLNDNTKAFLRRYNPVQYVESRPTFQRSMCYLLAFCFMMVFLLGLLLNPKYGGDMFLRNVGLLSTDYNPSVSRG
jgi:hypothetical protein